MANEYILQKIYEADNIIFVWRWLMQVGDPQSDHICWERPEDMDTPRLTLQINETAPGSEVAAETAAALAAASMVFKPLDPIYAEKLLVTAMTVSI